MTDTPEIITTGFGWFEQTGDEAELTATFAAVAPTRSDAVALLGEQLKALEVPLVTAVLRSRRMWVRSEYEETYGQQPRVVGCRAGQDWVLHLTDTAALEDVLATLIAAEPTDLNGPRWLLRDPASAQREAQHRAVASARNRAEGYAEALGGTLGPLRSLAEEHWEQGLVTPLAFAAKDSSGGGPVIRDLGLEPEPVRVSARCTTTWTLLT
ncbi:SIMPL domain-containing protein [Pseudonocardia sp. GCM10023141]|uniref:SIMPL domain-containing protein n=1 Tax=Pseudonocardia sp. GCM10023141 TaxID=3252653 RepID=UPI003622F26D